MKSLIQNKASSLEWRQPHLMEPLFELKGDGELYASLKFSNSFGSLATGITAEGEWTFKRLGFLSTMVTVRAKGSQQNLVIYRNNTWSGGGTLEYPDGRKVQVNSNFWQSRYEFRDESGIEMLQFVNIGGFRLHSQLLIGKETINSPDLPWLVLLGWYLAVMTSREGEMVAAVI